MPVIAAINSAVCCAAAAGPRRPVRTASSIACNWAETRGRAASRDASPRGPVGRRSVRENARSTQRARRMTGGTGSALSRARPCERLGRDDVLEEAHRQCGLRRLAEDPVHHGAGALAGAPAGPPGTGAKPWFQSLLSDTPSARASVAASWLPEADRRFALGEQPDRAIPLTCGDLGRHRPVPIRLRRKRRACAVSRVEGHPVARERPRRSRRGTRSGSRGRLAAPRPAGHDDRVRASIRTSARAKARRLGPGGGRFASDRLEVLASVPETRDVGEGGDAERPALVAVASTSASRKSTSCSSRAELVQVIEREKRSRELGGRTESSTAGQVPAPPRRHGSVPDGASVARR